MAHWNPGHPGGYTQARAPIVSASTWLRVLDIPMHLKGNDILYAFKPYGACTIVKKDQQVTNIKDTSYGYVRFATQAEADAARLAMDGRFGMKVLFATKDPVRPGHGTRKYADTGYSTAHNIMPTLPMLDIYFPHGVSIQPHEQRILQLETILKERLAVVIDPYFDNYIPPAGTEAKFWIMQTIEKYLEIVKLVGEILLDRKRAHAIAGDEVKIGEIQAHLRGLGRVQSQFDSGFVAGLDRNNYMPEFRTICKQLWMTLRYYRFIKTETGLEQYVYVVNHIYHLFDKFMLTFDLFEI